MDNFTFFVVRHEFVLVGLTFSICALIVLLQSNIPGLNGRAQDLHSVQAAHTNLTPRLGGVAVFATLCIGIVFVPVENSTSYGKFMLATGVLFTVGLLEDIGFRVPPRRRLAAAAVASLVVIGLFGVWIPRADIPGLDLFLHHWMVGIPLTLFATVGIANGFNLIDGVNGLAAVTAVAGAVALGVIAENGGYTTMMDLTLILVAGITGFLLLNYPFGLIFLGDAGAYTIGFVLSWFGIAVLLNVPDASPWAILLTLFWPVADTLLAIYRRVRRAAAPMAADRLHVHQIMMRALEICVLGRKRRHIANPLSTLILAPFVILPPIAGALLWDQTIQSFAAVMVFGILLFASYAAAPSLIRQFRKTARGVVSSVETNQKIPAVAQVKNFIFLERENVSIPRFTYRKPLGSAKNYPHVCATTPLRVSK